MTELLQNRSTQAALIDRQIALVAGVEPGLRGKGTAALVMSGIASAAGVDYGDVQGGALRDYLSLAVGCS